MRLRVITFDLDDTLWDVRPALIRAEQDTRAWLQLHAPDMLATHDSTALQGIRAALVANDPTLAHRLSQLRRDTYYHALLGTGYAPNQAAHLADTAFKVFLDARHGVEPYEGVAELLAELSQRYVLGALSNGNADLQHIAIGAHFKFQFSAEQVGAAKPDPAMFVAALAHCEAAPDHMLHVGDNAEHDILGAHNAGIRSVWVKGRAEGYPTDIAVAPIARIDSVVELPNVLASLR